MRPGSLFGVTVIAVLGIVAGNANAATPSPDPPPLGVAPETPTQAPEPTPARTLREAPAVTRTAVVETPVVTRTVTTPVVATKGAPARPVPKKAATKRPAQAAPKPPRRQVTATPPERTHDRPLLPAPAVAVAVDELDRGALALAGGGLAFVAFGGAVLLFATRRQLQVLSR